MVNICVNSSVNSCIDSSNNIIEQSDWSDRARLSMDLAYQWILCSQVANQITLWFKLAKQPIRLQNILKQPINLTYFSELTNHVYCIGTILHDVTILHLPWTLHLLSVSCHFSQKGFIGPSSVKTNNQYHFLHCISDSWVWD